MTFWQWFYSIISDMKYKLSYYCVPIATNILIRCFCYLEIFWLICIEINRRAGVYFTILKRVFQTLNQLLLWYPEITNSGGKMNLFGFVNWGVRYDENISIPLNWMKSFRTGWWNLTIWEDLIVLHLKAYYDV